MISMAGRSTPEEALTTPAPPPAREPQQVAADSPADAAANSRVRVLPVDPKNLYCYWTLEPELTASLIDELGVRAAALCQLTLVVRATDKSSEWRAPIAAASLYVRALVSGRPHLVEMSLLLPSGERRLLAVSNVVAPPPERPSRRAPARVMSVKAGPRGARLTEVPRRVAREEESDSRPSALPSSWAMGGPGPGHFGASDLLGGASDVFRR